MSRQLTCALSLLCIVAGSPSRSFAQDKPLWSVSLYADDAPITKIGPTVLVGSDVFVADDDEMQVVRIDRTGKVTARFGRRGAGPGEFHDITWMGMAGGDSLYVWDSNQRRLSTFTTAGRFVRAESPEHTLADPIVFGRTAAGQWLVLTSTLRETTERGISIEQSILKVGSARTVREAPKELLSVPSKRLVKVVNGRTAHLVDLPAIAMSYVAGCNNGFLVGLGAIREVRAYDPAGKLLGVVKSLREPSTISGAQRTKMIESWAGVTYTEGEPRTDPRLAQQFANAFDVLLPQRVQVSEQFVVGDDRSLWLAPTTRFSRWQLLGADGEGEPQLPISEGLSLRAVNANYIVARTYGDDERLELWRRPSMMHSPSTKALRALGNCSPALVR